MTTRTLKIHVAPEEAQAYESASPEVQHEIDEVLRRKLSEFEAALDQLAETFEEYAGPNVSPLPDDAVTRVGIYRDHL